MKCTRGSDVKKYEKYYIRAAKIMLKYSEIDQKLRRPARVTDKAVFEYARNKIKISPTDKVLDIGCATGEKLFLLRASDLKAGIDLGLAFLKVGRRRYPSCQFVQADACTLPFRNNAFNKVVSFEVIEHIPSPQKMISEMYRTLKTGGEMVITTPNRLGLSWIFHIIVGRLFSKKLIKFLSPTTEKICRSLYGNVWKEDDELAQRCDVKNVHIHDFSFGKMKKLLNKQHFRIKSSGTRGFPALFPVGLPETNRVFWMIWSVLNFFLTSVPLFGVHLIVVAMKPEECLGEKMVRMEKAK